MWTSFGRFVFILNTKAKEIEEGRRWKEKEKYNGC